MASEGESDDDSDSDGTADTVELFASRKDVGAEGTGIYFGKDDRTLFVNIQHADKPLADGTWIITNRRPPALEGQRLRSRDRTTSGALRGPVSCGTLLTKPLGSVAFSG